MKKYKALLSVLCSALFFIAGMCAFADEILENIDEELEADTPPRKESASPAIPFFQFSLDILNYYPVFSMETGADILTSAYRLGVWGSGLLVDLIPLEENNFWTKTAGIGLRLLKGALLDVNLVMLSFILEHEYFGHGARHREMTMNYTGEITIDIFPKFWYNIIPPFVGLSFFNAGSFSSDVGVATYEETLIIQTAGAEANAVMALHAQELMFRANKLDYSLSFLYLNTRIFSFMYIATALRDETAPDFPGFTDYEYYIQEINNSYGYTDPATYPLKSSMLRNANLWNLVDPFFIYCLVADFRYYWSGEQELSLWLPEVFGVSFLPSLYVNTAFFGLETYVYLTGLINKSLFYRFYVRWGDGVFHSPLETSGIGLRLSVIDPTSIFQGIDLDAWVQPLDGTSRFGFSISAEINPKIIGDNFLITAGFKTKGYLMNEPFTMCGFGNITVRF